MINILSQREASYCISTHFRLFFSQVNRLSSIYQNNLQQDRLKCLKHVTLKSEQKKEAFKRISHFHIQAEKMKV